MRSISLKDLLWRNCFKRTESELRGEITFTPLTIGEEDDKSADVSDEKEVAVTDCKKPKKGKK